MDRLKASRALDALPRAAEIAVGAVLPDDARAGAATFNRVVP
jgi:hypothetical protein